MNKKSTTTKTASKKAMPKGFDSEAVRARSKAKNAPVALAPVAPKKAKVVTMPAVEPVPVATPVPVTVAPKATTVPAVKKEPADRSDAAKRAWVTIRASRAAAAARATA